MFEIEMNGTMYQFNFGMGFMRDADRGRKAAPDPNGIVENIGFRYMVAGIMQGSCESLEEALLLANKGFEPRVTMDILDKFIENECTDIDKLFDDVLGFLRTANATKKPMKSIEKDVEFANRIKEKQIEAQMNA